MTDYCGWTELDRRAVDTARVLAMDAVQKAGNGHPGTAMSLAPVAYLLFQRVMRHDPTDPRWPGRDRFVLSCGHTSLTLYIQLYLAGYGLELDDLKALRTWGSLDAGPPRVRAHRRRRDHHRAARPGPRQRGRHGDGGPPRARPARPGRRARRERLRPPRSTSSPRTATSRRASAGEASSLAGHQQLGNLVVIYDQNHISIEDDTDVAFTEDVAGALRGLRLARPGRRLDAARAQAGKDGTTTRTSRPCRTRSRPPARDRAGRRSSILRTIIAWPAPNAQNTGKAHGSALGEDEVAATKKVLGFDPDKNFEVDRRRARARPRGRRPRPAAHAEWHERFAMGPADPERAELLDRLRERRLPAGWEEALPAFDADAKGVATRKALRRGAHRARPTCCPSCGAARPTWPSPTTPRSRASRRSSRRGRTRPRSASGDPYGRVLHFGIREHAMGSIMNGIALHGGTRVYGGTFLVFTDYMRAAVRLAALRSCRSPTSGPTTRSASARTARPTSRSSTSPRCGRSRASTSSARRTPTRPSAAWTDDPRAHRPAGRARPDPAEPADVRPRGTATASPPPTASREAAYVLHEADGGTPDVILIGTGSEVQLAVAAAELLAEPRASPPGSCRCRAASGSTRRTRPTATTVLPAVVRARV